MRRWTASFNAAQNNDILILGDFQNCVTPDPVGATQVEFIPHLFGVATPTSRPTGQRGWYAWFRTGADSVNDAAFRLLRA